MQCRGACKQSKPKTAEYFTWDSTREKFKPTCKSCVAEAANAQRRAKGVPQRIRMSYEERRHRQNELDKLRREKLKSRGRIEPDYTEKQCNMCQQIRPLSDFWREGDTLDSYARRCKLCMRPKAAQYAREWNAKNWARAILSTAKSGCSQNRRKRNLDFSIDENHINELWDRQQGMCYWFDIALIPSSIKKYPQKPTLERLDGKLGYVPDNVVLAMQRTKRGTNVMLRYLGNSVKF